LSKINRLNEAEVKLAVGDWLSGLRFRVLDGKRNKDRPDWGVFAVRKIDRGKHPGLVVYGTLKVARNVKPEIFW
jgi:hypothetical protein